MDAIESVKIELHKGKEHLIGHVEVLCSSGEVTYLDLDDATVWLITCVLQNFVIKEGERNVNCICNNLVLQ